jgi:glycosyltransferase involved in cell wall biosynthesis
MNRPNSKAFNGQSVFSMRILLSVPYSSNLFDDAPEIVGHEIVARRRQNDWGQSRARRLFGHLREIVRILKDANSFDAVVFMTMGSEIFFASRLKRWLCPRTALIGADILLARQGIVGRWIGKWIHGADGLVVVRNGDRDTLARRYGLESSRCEFVPFPSPSATGLPPSTDDGFIYSAGWAHRDWETFAAAMEQVPYRAIVSPGTPFTMSPAAAEHVTILPMQSPQDGRQYLAAASVVVLAMKDTDLPSGPLIMLDAFVAGKAVIATAVNGTRDYLVDGVTGLMVPPGDPAALAAAIHRVMEDPALRARLGRAAQEVARNEFTVRNYLTGIVSACEHYRCSDAVKV